MAPIAGVYILQGDITTRETVSCMLKAFGGQKAELVVCDGAPDITGFHEIDQYIQSQLILSAINIASQVTKEGGIFVAKIFKGKEIEFLFAQMKVFYEDVYCTKPKSSRNSSQEAFIVGKGFKYSSPHPLCDGKLLPSATMEEEKESVDEATKAVISFVQCGNLSLPESSPATPDTDSSLSDYLNLFNA
eukprot:TRINITY_DN3233_c0_g1_i8.p1 TRINITY_DN3233_c0_g1~~TRINITY_DN3233_c0_g1_i8.p1  ORF type:complete len:189 (-),score=46.95 TRINITY_DN3233_c0_g1_i8:42-608(-)